MKPKKFLPGDDVTLKNRITHTRIVAGPDANRLPSFGEVYRVLSVNPAVALSLSSWYIDLGDQFNTTFNEDAFERVVTTHELESELSEIEITVAI